MSDKRKKDKEELEANIAVNIKRITEPYLEKIKRTSSDGDAAFYVDALELSLNDVASPFFKRLAFSSEWNFTPQEIKVAELVKNGKETKEIARTLNLSNRTVEFHRNNIRRKFNLSKKTNLMSYLMAIA